MHALVAEDGGELVGFTHFVFHRSTSRAKDLCYLEDLFTKEPARGRGVGRALIEAVYGIARAHEATHVYWQTHETNEVAQKLYRQVAVYSGFVVYEKAL